jgi:hypothetical protein
MNKGTVAVTLRVAPWNWRSLSINLEGTRYEFRMLQATDVTPSVAEKLLNGDEGLKVAYRQGGFETKDRAFEAWDTRQTKVRGTADVERELADMRAKLNDMYALLEQKEQETGVVKPPSDEEATAAAGSRKAPGDVGYTVAEGNIEKTEAGEALCPFCDWKSEPSHAGYDPMRALKAHMAHKKHAPTASAAAAEETEDDL